MLNETQIGDFWLLFSDYIDKKQTELVAERYIEMLADYGVRDRVLQGATGADPVLDQAIAYYLEDDEDEEEDDDDIKDLDF
jgi:hypothetical protein